MKRTITAFDTIQIISRISSIMNENEGYLTDLDAAIGDADHGINMNRGFKYAKERLTQIESKEDLGSVLMAIGMALMETVGGAAGPLYGIMFTNMAMTASGKAELDKENLTALFKEGLKGVQEIGGGTQIGDKTMVDALYPALVALEKAKEDNNIDLVQALKEAAKGAEQGVKSTIPLIAKKGRASYLGERAIGHQDPGATSTFLIIKTIYEYMEEK